MVYFFDLETKVYRRIEGQNQINSGFFSEVVIKRDLSNKSSLYNLLLNGFESAT